MKREAQSTDLEVCNGDPPNVAEGTESKSFLRNRCHPDVHEDFERAEQIEIDSREDHARPSKEMNCSHRRKNELDRQTKESSQKQKQSRGVMFRGIDIFEKLKVVSRVRGEDNRNYAFQDQSW